MWNCGDTSPMSRLSTRETSLACCGDQPRYTPLAIVISICDGWQYLSEGLALIHTMGIQMNASVLDCWPLWFW